MSTPSANRNLVWKLSMVALAMFGFGFAMVPFYSKICELAGLNQIQQRDAVAAGTRVDVTRLVQLQFDANLRSELPWTFKPLTTTLSVHPGQLVHVVYEVTNASQRSVFGQAVPSYAPQQAAKYFKKLECFCFTRQELKAGETRRMPVVFVIEPDLPVDVHTITLSYTFFQVEGAGPKPG